MRSQSAGWRYQLIAVSNAQPMAIESKSLNTMPVPTPVAGSKCATESARPPVRRTIGIVP